MRGKFTQRRAWASTTAVLEDDSYHQNFDLCYNDEHIPSEVVLSIFELSRRSMSLVFRFLPPPVILVLDQALIA